MNAYKCSECKERFPTFTDLISHKNITKHCTCEVCGKVFATKWNLKCHVRKHTGEKPYTCSVCGEEFSWSPKLKNHLAVVHRRLNIDTGKGRDHGKTSGAHTSTVVHDVTNVRDSYKSDELRVQQSPGKVESWQDEDGNWNEPSDNHKYLGIIQCKLCKYHCIRKKDLVHHMIVYHKEKHDLYVCETCDFYSLFANSIPRHMNLCHKIDTDELTDYKPRKLEVKSRYKSEKKKKFAGHDKYAKSEKRAKSEKPVHAKSEKHANHNKLAKRGRPSKNSNTYSVSPSTSQLDLDKRLESLTAASLRPSSDHVAHLLKPPDSSVDDPESSMNARCMKLVPVVGYIKPYMCGECGLKSIDKMEIYRHIERYHFDVDATVVYVPDLSQIERKIVNKSASDENKSKVKQSAEEKRKSSKSLKHVESSNKSKHQSSIKSSGSKPKSEGTQPFSGSKSKSAGTQPFSGSKSKSEGTQLYSGSKSGSEGTQLCSDVSLKSLRSKTLSSESNIVGTTQSESSDANNAWSSSSIDTIQVKPKFWTCLVCRFQERRRADMFEHLLVKHKSKPFKCSECKLGFCHRWSFKRHVKTQHMGNAHCIALMFFNYGGQPLNDVLMAQTSDEEVNDGFEFETKVIPDNKVPDVDKQLKHNEERSLKSDEERSLKSDMKKSLKLDEKVLDMNPKCAPENELPDADVKLVAEADNYKPVPLLPTGNKDKIEKDYKGRKVYYCDKCPYKSTSLLGIRVHAYSHQRKPGKKQLKCDYCDYFGCAKSLMTHYKLHTGRLSKQSQLAIPTGLYERENRLKTRTRNLLERQLRHVEEETSLPESKRDPVTKETSLLESKRDPIAKETSLIESKRDPIAKETSLIESRHNLVTTETSLLESIQGPVTRETERPLRKNSYITPRKIDGKFYCLVCSFSSKRKSVFKKHKHWKKKTSGTITYKKCKLCPFQSPQSMKFAKHTKCHQQLPGAKFKCRYCNFWSVATAGARRHEKIHAEFKDDLVNRSHVYIYKSTGNFTEDIDRVNSHKSSDESVSIPMEGFSKMKVTERSLWDANFMNGSRFIGDFDSQSKEEKIAMNDEGKNDNMMEVDRESYHGENDMFEDYNNDNDEDDTGNNTGPLRTINSSGILFNVCKFCGQDFSSLELLQCHERRHWLGSEDQVKWL